MSLVYMSAMVKYGDFDSALWARLPDGDALRHGILRVYQANTCMMQPVTQDTMIARLAAYDDMRSSWADNCFSYGCGLRVDGVSAMEPVFAHLFDFTRPHSQFHALHADSGIIQHENWMHDMADLTHEMMRGGIKKTADVSSMALQHTQPIIAFAGAQSYHIVKVDLFETETGPRVVFGQKSFRTQVYPHMALKSFVESYDGMYSKRFYEPTLFQSPSVMHGRQIDIRQTVAESYEIVLREGDDNWRDQNTRYRIS